MPRRSKISTLDAETRAWLDQALMARGFSGYEELEDLLESRGYKVGKSTIHRHGEKLERRIAAIKASTEAAQMIASAAPDQEDALSASVISMIQSDTFEVLLTLKEAEDADPATRLKLLNQAGRAIAELSRASIHQKRWAAEARERERELAAQRAEEAALEEGLDGEAAARIAQKVQIYLPDNQR